MKRFSMTITAAAIMATTAFLSAPAQAGGVSISFGHGNHRTIGHTSHRTVTHNPVRSFNRVSVGHINHTICKGYYTNQSYQYWVQGYYDQRWVNTSRWIVDGLTAGGQANHVWITDGYYESYWVNGYWATGYNRVWVGDGCHRCR